MDPAKARDFLGRLGKGGKGAGSGLGVLGAAAALGYGIYKSMYTGKEAGMPASIIGGNISVLTVWGIKPPG